MIQQHHGRRASESISDEELLDLLLNARTVLDVRERFPKRSGMPERYVLIEVDAMTAEEIARRREESDG